MTGVLVRDETPAGGGVETDPAAGLPNIVDHGTVLRRLAASEKLRLKLARHEAVTVAAARKLATRILAARSADTAGPPPRTPGLTWMRLGITLEMQQSAVTRQYLPVITRRKIADAASRLLRAEITDPQAALVAAARRLTPPIDWEPLALRLGVTETALKKLTDPAAALTTVAGWDEMLRDLPTLLAEMADKTEKDRRRLLLDRLQEEREQQLLDMLRQIRRDRWAAEDGQVAVVGRAREIGVTWERIGEELGLARSNVVSKFKDRIAGVSAVSRQRLRLPRNTGPGY